MIHKPEYGFEFDFDSGFEDEFLDANSQEEKTVEVSGFIFKTDREYHQIIRKIKAIEISDGVNDDAIASRTQSYRVKGMFDGSNNNIIKCEVYKPEVEMVHDEISFTFGLHTTNGTKYTMAINWVETALDGETYERPSALTVGETEKWKFDVKILNSAHEIVEPKDPKKGWDIELQWFENRIYGYDGGIEDFIKLNSKERTLTVKPPEDFKNTYHGNLQYQILEIKLAPNVFDYELTTYLPIPVRLSRNFIAMDGADRIYYDSTGYNPRFSDKAYNLLWRNVNKNKQEANKKDQERDLVVWGIKSTDDDADNPAPESQKPGLENKDNNYYLKAPGVYLPAAGADRFYGTCVYAKSAKKDENGNIVVGTTSQDLLWVQPLYITMDAYGSKFFND
jgi:hypothetical protein